MSISASLILGLVVLGQTPAQGPPKEWAEANEQWIGSWNMTGTIGGEKCTARYTYRWAEGKFALRGEATWNGAAGTGTGEFLSGWDSAKSQDVTFEVWSDGATWIYRAKVSAKKWTGVGEGVENGKRITSRFEQEFVGPDKVVFRATMVNQDSKEEVPCELVFTRIARAKND